MNNYTEFLKSKHVYHKPSGFSVDLDDLNPMLFDWQKVLVRWSLRQGRSAMFESCGLGKTPQQLEWAKHVHAHTSEDVLILAPLAVASQTVREGAKFGIEVNQCRSQDGIKPGINITNYEMFEHFDSSQFVGIVLDESSILKAFMGKTKQKLMNVFRDTPYKLCCTATPSPNDHMELLNHSDFLNVMPSNEALSRWFINDTMNFGTYRLKGHGESDFWQWVSTWAVCLNTPSDIGFDDNGFVLPELKTIEHIVDMPAHDFKNGLLFRQSGPISATGLYRELRETAPQRCKKAAELANESDDMWIVWCNTNYEADRLKKLIPDAVNVHGSMTLHKKEAAIESFAKGDIRVMITKPSMCGFGLNWQHVHDIAFVGLSYSFEQRYQAVRRSWRFGQKHPVNDHVILSPEEKGVFRAVLKKQENHAEMSRNMTTNITGYHDFKNERVALLDDYKKKSFSGENWELIVGDSVKEIKRIESDSIGFTLFSPPFSNLYIYSDFVQDMGNSKNDKEFFTHFNYLIPELFRTTIPGRLCAVHCKDLVNYKSRDGRAGIRDFSGDVIKAFESHGWQYHSRITIWKDPVIEMQRTKAQGLLHKQIKKDSSMSRQGLPDYIVVFRKWPDTGETSGPDPVHRPIGFEGYAGDMGPEPKQPDEDDRYSIHVWQRYASPVWFDIRQTNVLNARIAREDCDEKHICPLQLDVIERCVHLWTKKGDTVFTPFAGVGSEMVGALQLGRKAIGIELKESYAKEAAKFMEKVDGRQEQLKLFN